MKAGRAPLVVLGCGMATAVGLTAPATCAAIRARIDGLRETRFMSRDGGWIIGAEAPLEPPLRGLARLAQLLAASLRECFDHAPELEPEQIPVLLGTAEADRPGRLAGLDSEFAALLQRFVGARFHPESRLIPMGRMSGALGLQAASKLINEQGFSRVIVAGVDSYLLAATLAGYDERRRLLTEDNPNGFIPGEGAAALLVGPGDAGPGLAVRSLGLAVEKATIEGEEPLRADGLALAYRQALDAVELGLHEIDYRIADISGEQYRFKEMALALARTMRVRKEFQDVWHPADCVGETGAAAMPIMLGVALTAGMKRYAPGPLALAQAGNDDGRRAVLVLESRGAA
jgi:3-oxoacyl-[acyl-carrier-protein] synthase-1